MMVASKIPAVTGEFRENEPLSRHTSWRVGGPAESFFRPADLEDLSLFLRELDAETPVFWLGLGSNLLVRDSGIRGVVIAAAGIFKDLERVADLQVRAGVSLPCTQLARQCVRWGLGPSEFFAGIPGTVGGALAMNAGAHGSETWELVHSVTMIDRQGNVRIRSPGEFQIGYRSVTRINNENDAHDEWFVEALLEFDAGVGASQETLKALLARRKDTQPLGLPSCGSVFRNPQGDFAARLIEAAGLKGHRIGGAEVSTKHANFIINRNDASAADIEALISHVQRTVSEIHGVDLVHEVRIIGEAAS
jgi:UDP-N-acetylmuramate dehydrogenase